jgi:tRNA nucleotidyltransferase/poly(A) polymerase
MKLSYLLNLIDSISKSKGISTPYIVGGLPRDKILKRYNDFGDIDLTTGDSGSHLLAQEVFKSLRKIITEFKRMNDGHYTMIIGGLKVDFSSNFKIPGIGPMLSKAGFPNITEMTKEIFSRDFTCNSLLMSMDLKEITDPTGMGINDIGRRLIRTCLPPNITLGYDNKRIARALYLSAKLDFNVDSKVIEWIKNNPDASVSIDQKYFAKKIAQGLKYNKSRVIDFLNQTELWDKVPVVESLIPYIKKDMVRR